MVFQSLQNECCGERLADMGTNAPKPKFSKPLLLLAIAFWSAVWCGLFWFLMISIWKGR
jgi:hypothetical protein